MSYCLLCSDVCSLGHCVASWTSTLPGSICDVAVRHSHILIVARGFRTWISACRVLHPVLLHAHAGLLTFPCLWRTGSFPHSLTFYATDTASTLTASWSRWSPVTSVPVAVGFGIWLDWPTPRTLHIAVLGATVCSEDAEANRWVSALGLPVVSKLDASFEPTISTSKRPQHHTSYCAVIGTGSTQSLPCVNVLQFKTYIM